jgi:hypothetical protein
MLFSLYWNASLYYLRRPRLDLALKLYCGTSWV